MLFQELRMNKKYYATILILGILSITGCYFTAGDTNDHRNLPTNKTVQTAPSFDCAKATTEVEKLICSDDELAKLDVEMNKWYKKARLWRATYSKLSNIELQDSQNRWLQRRNNFECLPKEVDKKKCLTSLYNEAIQVWKNKLLDFEFSRICNHGINRGCVFDYTDKLLKEGADLNGYAGFYGECWFGPVYYSALGWNKKEVFDYVVKNGADFTMPVRDDCQCKQVLDSQGGFYFFDEIMELNPNTNLNKWQYWRNLLPKSIRGKVKLSTDKCINYSKEYQKYIKKLVDYGANVNITNESGDNILYIIFNYPSTAKDFPFDYELTLSMLKYLIANGLDISHENKNGHNALYYLQNSPFKINENYYTKFEKLFTPQNKGEKHD